MYFTIGGRKTQSGLYRVTYVGKESTAPAKADDAGAECRALRHKLEAFHGKADPKAVEAAWPYLGHEDRFIRFAARVALEHQDPKTWQDKRPGRDEPGRGARRPARPGPRVADRPAHHRASDADRSTRRCKGRILAALDRSTGPSSTTSSGSTCCASTRSLFNRLGKPDAATREQDRRQARRRTTRQGRELNAKLCQMLVYLEAPTVAAKTLKLMAEAPTQEEQMEYARALRVLKAGWTPAQRKEYFRWYVKAPNYRGGNSFQRLPAADEGRRRRDADAGREGRR